ncbi:putative transmembrane anti-sigma factor [Rubrobacter xylanophilus DSM 9941]|uniref:Putative transmembrane anti-sigma factor n=2 Tax=Rubrobacter xylanophilus TaxID=49319 RepID=Q1AVA9_RUBXD|nr:putative transmembrane anti-sigma factor [Rubrobacter xylanophilus DSM 9941]
MMDPRAIEELLPAYAAGELSGEEARRVEAALEGSPRLREELARYERLFVLLAAAAEQEISAPEGLQGQVARRVAIAAYLGAAANLAGDILGAYGRALVYYLGLA